MAGLSRIHQQAVHDLLRGRLERVALNATWRRIQVHFEVGTFDGRWLQFDRQQREILRQLAQQEWGFDPLEGVPDGTRLEVAGQAIDEKTARQRPDDSHVLVKGALPAPLPLLSPELSLRVPLASLDLAAIAQVLVIENLDSFDDWQHYVAPIELAGSLLLYRGHGGLARGVHQLLNSLPASTRVIVFPDYDPAGLKIAATSPRATALLLPEPDEHLLAKGSRQHFDEQFQEARYLDGAELGSWQPVWDEMKARQVSIKQQHMLALGVRLRIVPRHPR
ncbi:hypothetical protein D3C81_1066830 [compost metagenome]